MCSELNKSLRQIKELLQQERSSFISLKMEALPQMLQKKIQILTEISRLTPDSDNVEQQQLLREIKVENRRNARLITQAEQRVGRCLSFYIKRQPSGYYGCSGAVRPDVIPCQLLCGRI